MKAASPSGECDWIQRPHNLKLGVANMIPATQYAVRKLQEMQSRHQRDPKGPQDSNQERTLIQLKGSSLSIVNARMETLSQETDDTDKQTLEN